ncbi:hypothetical protein [Streptococcus equi]|uniref:hypothetical protein n=1 Tax=Streptococcus equi TaxID=1336 RepID=UPI0039C5CE7A
MKTKIFSRLAAVLLVLGSLLPTAVTVAKAESQRQTDLVIHKIKMTSLVGWPKEKNPDGTYTGDNNQNYNGEKINTIIFNMKKVHLILATRNASSTKKSLFPKRVVLVRSFLL